MILEDRLRIAIGRRRDEVFLRTEFARLGSEAQLSRALRALVADGVLVKIGKGVYAKAEPSVLSGNPIPVQPLEILAERALHKLGVPTFPTMLEEEYNSGQSTQVPSALVINTGRRRIARKLSFGKRVVSYENNYSRAA